MPGAGGTDGGTGRFVLGLAMLVAGAYLFFKSIVVTTHFGLGYGLYSFGSFRLTTGMVMMPFIFGVGWIFYNAKSFIGWTLAAASLIMLMVGVISSMHFSFARMSAFDVIMIFILLFGGLGLFLSSLRGSKRRF